MSDSDKPFNNKPQKQLIKFMSTFLSNYEIIIITVESLSCRRLPSLFFYRYSQCELMIFFRCSILICNLLLVALLTSVFAVASANNFTYSNHGVSNESMLKMVDPAVDGQLCDESEIILKSQQRWVDALKAVDNDSKASPQCCSFVTVLTLFPVTATTQLKRVQVASLALIGKKQPEKTHSFSELIYRPPIG